MSTKKNAIGSRDPIKSNLQDSLVEISNHFPVKD